MNTDNSIRKYNVTLYPPGSHIPCKFGFTTDSKGNVKGDYLRQLLDRGWELDKSSIVQTYPEERDSYLYDNTYDFNYGGTY
jgi:hypothetical protein